METKIEEIVIKKKNDTEIELEDNDFALILAINDLKKSIKELNSAIRRFS